jgi:hypothetical protein
MLVSFVNDLSEAVLNGCYLFAINILLKGRIKYEKFI